MVWSRGVSEWACRCCGHAGINIWRWLPTTEAPRALAMPHLKRLSARGPAALPMKTTHRRDSLARCSRAREMILACVGSLPVPGHWSAAHHRASALACLPVCQSASLLPPSAASGRLAVELRAERNHAAVPFLRRYRELVMLAT